ncbi:MAG: transporter [Oleispira antarctica]|uniref:Flagellar protein FilC n=1 Tax=Oleispira antarctica RB-8 TaxID=698738 RepID=R4YN20_OLEAN|nr:transporter [Oleispira antarctica]MBQ0793988.1 transporter [Oleispira antarctica]CCK76195.1 conserved hypothetical protein [Oleispira antarctica RB-8]|tara:strand:- start:3507 stop:4559 length:1053 start_codon:yes stop_codon:yes gene_type:complete
MGIKLHSSLLLIALSATGASLVQAADVSEAREALTKQATDTDTEQALEEVFEAAESSYSLLKKGGMSLNYSFDYSYYGDQRLSLLIAPQLDNNGDPNGSSNILSADVSPSASHTFTNSFSLDYGLLDNVTIGGRIPLVAKFDTEEDMTNYAMGDLSGTVRWQPWGIVPGTISKTLFGSLKLKTADSPYEVDPNKNLATGSGYYSISGGGSISKVLDPVVLFGSGTYGYNIPETDLNQVRDGAILKEVHPGSSLSGSMGFAYSLSYDVSLSVSFQASYNDETKFVLQRGRNKINSTVGSQVTGIMNFALGVRISPKTITNINVGFGMTESAPDFMVGFSMPIDIEGVKASL